MGKVIQNGVFIGTKSIILAPVAVSKNPKIGASSVVLQDIPDGCTAV